MNGNLIISLDFELLWGLSGWSKDQIKEYFPHVQNSIKSLELILAMFEDYKLKSTVAYVGAMSFNDKEELANFIDFDTPKYSNPLFSSYESIFTLINFEYSSSFFFCPDVIESLKVNPLVELASHTFSHYYCLEGGVSPKDFENDLIAMKKLSPSLKTIIFPRNQINNELLALCSKYGFTHFRGKSSSSIYKATRTESRYTLNGALRLLDAYVPISGSQCFALDSTKDEIKNIPESCFLRPYSQTLSFLEPLKRRRIMNDMEKAAKKGLNYHIWWHPHNFGINTQENLDMLRVICEKFKELSETYNFQTKFISEL